jgi:hypothetical protein
MPACGPAAAATGTACGPSAAAAATTCCSAILLSSSPISFFSSVLVSLSFVFVGFFYVAWAFALTLLFLIFFWLSNASFGGFGQMMSW